MTLEEQQALREDQKATRALLKDFLIHIAVLGYTGQVKDGHPIANTSTEMLSKYDPKIAWEALMAERGVDITKIPLEIQKALVINTEVIMKTTIYGHGKVPGTIDAATAANMS